MCILHWWTLLISCQVKTLLITLLHFHVCSSSGLQFSIHLSIWNRLSLHANVFLACSRDSCVFYFGWGGIWSSLHRKDHVRFLARSSLTAGHGLQSCKQNSVAASRLPLLRDSVEDNLPYLAPCREICPLFNHCSCNSVWSLQFPERLWLHTWTSPRVWF